MPRIISALFISFIFLTCRQPGTRLPAGAEWIRPVHSRLFLLGHRGQDSFLALRHPDDSSRWLQIIHWGSGSAPDGCIHLKNRKTVAAMSAVFTGMMEELGATTMLTGIDNHRYPTTPLTRRRIKAGRVTELAPTGTLNKEILLRLNPDITLAYYIDNKGGEQWKSMEKAGLTVVYCQNFLESHPLGRAEWIRAFGWLLGRPQQAEAVFDMVREHYESTRAAVASLDEPKPAVLCNAPYSGTWDLPSGDSYMARLIADAGGAYIWASKSGAGHFTLGLETVFKEAGDADIWINPGGCRNLDCLRSMDKRLGLFAPVKNQRVYNNTAITTGEGGNAWWDYAVARPDLALKDLARIFHPLQFPEHQPVFFEPLK